jgi:hypothetical protein
MITTRFDDLLDALFFAEGAAVGDELDFQSVLLGNRFCIVSNSMA